MELINRTILPTKQKGDGLSAAEINSINNTVNSLVEYVNANLRKYCNLGIECGDSKKYTLSTAISAVPEGRRSLGMTIKFLSSEDDLYHSYVYLGKELTSSAWLSIDNWFVDDTVIDGGVWQ